MFESCRAHHKTNSFQIFVAEAHVRQIRSLRGMARSLPALFIAVRGFG